MRVLAAAGPTATPPQVLQTHISTLVLAGDTAWKLKRPVRLPFLDFSTTAARHHFLLEELRLNQRTAPDLYRDVVPLLGDADAPRIGTPLTMGIASLAPAPSDNTCADTTHVLDWALRMTRFDLRDELHTRACAGLLNTSDIDALAKHLASFHAALPPLDQTALPGGSLPAVWDWAASCLNDMARHTTRPTECSRERLAAVRRTLKHQLAEYQSLMAQRCAAGWVRECHGDLHLGNLVRWQGQVLAFDALEFDGALRRIDVVCDIAFTFMDLLAHDHAALAWRLVSAWCEQLADRSGLALLHPFATYRALVRAKVALLGGDATSFTRYWALAEALLRPRAPPTLVLTAGLSGSGKSTAAQYVCEALGAVRVRSDVERKRLLHLAPTHRATEGTPLQRQLYATETTQATYARLADIAGSVLQAGLPVVVDAAALRQYERAALRELAQRHGARFLLLWCEAPDDVLPRRMAQRARLNLDPSDATAALLPLQRQVCEPLPLDDPSWNACTRVIHNHGTLAELATQVFTALAAARRLP